MYALESCLCISSASCVLKRCYKTLMRKGINMEHYINYYCLLSFLSAKRTDCLIVILLVHMKHFRPWIVTKVPIILLWIYMNECWVCLQTRYYIVYFLCISFIYFLLDGAVLIFTVWRYAKRGICRRRVSVCVSVCHTPVLYQNV